MRHTIPVVFYIILLAGASLKAQSSTEIFASSEQINAQYGETDNKYLDILTRAITKAYEEEKFEEASRLRTIHSKIVQNKYGKLSLEYAEDLWRLGNASHFRGDSYTVTCYKQAAEIYEHLNAKTEFPYCNLMWRLYSHYYNAQKWDSALTYLKKHIDYYEPWITSEWKGNSLTYIGYAHNYLILGDMYRNEFQDLSSANEAYEKCVTILEQNKLLDKYEHYWMPYQGLSLNYNAQQDYENAALWQRKLTEVIAKIEGYDSDNYIQTLSDLRYNYWYLHELDSIKSISAALLTHIQLKDIKLGIFIWQDSAYVKIQKELLDFCIIFQDAKGIVTYAPILLKLYEHNGMSLTEDYWDALGSLILAYHQLNDYLSSYALYTQYEELSTALGKQSSEDYWLHLMCKMEALTALYKLDECNATIEELKSLTARMYKPNSRQELLMIYQVANHQEAIDNHKQAQNAIEQCYHIIHSKNCHFYNTSDSLLILASLHSLEGATYIGSNPEKAKEKLLHSIGEYNTLGRYAHIPLTSLGLLYYQQKRDFKTAASYFKLARLSLEEMGDRSSIRYITILNNLGLCYSNQGMESHAIAIFDSVSQTVLANYGKQHALYGITEQNKSTFYLNISNYPEAIKHCKEALECFKQIFGTDSEKYALCLQNLGLMHQYAGDLPASKEILLRAIPILERLNSPYCLTPYTNLLAIYASEKDSNMIADCAEMAIKQLKDNHWEETDMAISLYGSIGYALLINGMPEAKSYLSHTLSLFDKTQNKSGSQYHYGLLLWGMSSFKDQSQSEDIIPILTESYKELYLKDAVFFNSSERESLIAGPRLSQTKNVLFSSRQDGSHDIQLYNFLLFNKGLLLGTAINYAYSIYNTGNEEIINKYTCLIRLNRFLNGEINANDIELSIDEAKIQSSTLEREITAHLRQNKIYINNLNYTYSDIQTALKTTDLAIEFVFFHDYADDITYYAAMLARHDWVQPKFVKLCAKKDLEKLVSLSPDKLYGKNIASENLYNLIWKPLTPYLTNIKTIYFSPAGYINRLAIEHLYNGKKHFDEMYKTIRITSSREICKNETQNKYTSAILYGGLQYDEDDTTIIEESRKYYRTHTVQPDIFRGINSSTTRKGWAYLPGTLEEVNQISSILSEAKINCDVYTAHKGNEESFKALSGTNFDILHIATHGFYITKTQTELNNTFLSNPFASQNTVSEISPLQRTGLLLSGGNKAWEGETVHKYVEDGILTATEITSLDLRNCDIVVLSACETGLGEITDEGVFGLQRAFKNAGVNTIVMSLWEVDDQATSLMMQVFYRNLLKNKSKHEAFSLAQEEVKKKYVSPRYWAAFIMLD